MFKRNVVPIRDLIMRNLRQQGLETPLLQKRIMDAWPAIAGQNVAHYTQETYIRNQTPARICKAIKRICRQPGDCRHTILLTNSNDCVFRVGAMIIIGHLLLFLFLQR